MGLQWGLVGVGGCRRKGQAKGSVKVKQERADDEEEEEEDENVEMNENLNHPFWSRRTPVCVCCRLGSAEVARVRAPVGKFDRFAWQQTHTGVLGSRFPITHSPCCTRHSDLLGRQHSRLENHPFTLIG